MNWHGAGCPLCGGGEEYRWGTDIPCGRCQREYQKALKFLPAGVDIGSWYGAREDAERILARGGTEEEARQKMRQSIMTDLELGRQLAEAFRRQSAPGPDSSCADHLFEGLNFN